MSGQARSEGSATDDDSRTAVISATSRAHASAPNSTTNSPGGPQSRKRKRARRQREQTQDSETTVAVGASHSKSAAYLDPSISTNSDMPQHTETPHPPNDESPVARMSLGKNRLATGFVAEQTAPPAASDLAQSLHSLSSDAEGSNNDPIAISSSDESMADSEDEGGMVVNIDHGAFKTRQQPDLSMSSADEGEIMSSPDDIPPPPPEDTSHPSPPTTGMKLEDLSSEELEDQIKYALYHLHRDQIDLNRPVTCLACLREGHMAASCAEIQCHHCDAEGQHSSRRCPQKARCTRCRQPGHSSGNCKSDMRVTTTPCDLCGALAHVEQTCPQRFFPTVNLKSEGGPVRLWISCAICASKSHLAGDCPDVDRSLASRWSLRSLAPGEYVNMTLETGTKRREVEAESRGMRPPGMQIRGRADMHRAGDVGSTASSEDDEAFLQPSVRRDAGPNNKPSFHFSRQDAAQDFRGRSGGGQGPPQGRGGWYATDSFGRRRSRSPQAGGDTYRPSFRRSPSPRRFDGRSQYRPRSPPRGAPSIDSYRPSAVLPPKPVQNHSRPQKSGSIAVSLPTRKGSNPNLLAKPAPPSDMQAKPQNPFGAGGSKKKKKKGKKNS